MIYKRTTSDYIINFIIYGFMTLMIVLVMYPFLNALAISFNNADDTTRGGIGLWPRVFSIASYRNIFINPAIWNAYGITIARTVIGTLMALFCTGLFAFGLAHKNLVGRRFYAIFALLIPMYFGGGIIPFYLLLRNLNLVNSFWVYIIPGLIGPFNVILMRTFFQEIPEALEESAMLDGANYLTIFLRIILPISTPIIATIALFVGVGHWNAWFDAAFYNTKEELKPMQSVLISIVNEAAYAERMAALSGGGAAAAQSAVGNVGRGRQANVRSITLATMYVTILPIIMIYPFLQRFFIKGIMIGSIKG
jgi:putative aldouronate transport system permease protein